MLSPRLQTVANFIPKGVVLADIGTDHAYLAIEVVSQGICKYAFACDLHPSPLKIAKKNIETAGLSDKIETRLGDGLSVIKPSEADCIVIAGMGGMRIWNIILEGIAQACVAKLILQPQHDVVLLRKNLHSSGFEIIDEVLIREKDHFYVVISSEYTGDKYSWSEREYFLGKYLIEKGGNDFNAFLQNERNKINAYISQINDDNALANARMRWEWLV